MTTSASFGAADSSRSRHPHSIYRVGKVSSLQNLQVSSSDCVRVPEGATREPSLIFGSLEKALFNLADMGLSLMELQKVPRASLRPYLSLSYIPAEPVCRVPSFEDSFFSDLLKGLLTLFKVTLN